MERGEPSKWNNANGEYYTSTFSNNREHHRSHRSKGSRTFLLSNPILEQRIVFNESHLGTGTKGRLREPRRGKETTLNLEKKHSTTGLGIGRGLSEASVVDAKVDQGKNSTPSDGAFIQTPLQSSEASMKPALAGLDAESAQIVNLALNLSESRRNATRRNILSPQAPALSGFTDSLSGGSLRQHLLQQRRASRNISPKPERIDRTISASQRTVGQLLDSPVQAAFSTYQDNIYQYHFSSSTLARAEKAKKTIELLAQYRRLLHYIPLLKPEGSVSFQTSSSPNTSPGSPSSLSRQTQYVSSLVLPTVPLGREYNPLQYIRNRKVRARERKVIDGESQGFGDVEKVTRWVDEVARASAKKTYQSCGRVLLPPFIKVSEDKPPSHAPPSATNRNQSVHTKSRRPRVDWITEPADMLADICWLEQNDNKRLIEDNRERKIFSQYDRSVPGLENKRQVTEPEIRPERSDLVLRLNTAFNSVHSNPDPHSDILRARERHRLHEDPHLLNGMVKSSHKSNLLKPYHRSSSESSEGEYLVPMRSRSATADTHDSSGIILEKQMMQILENEVRESTLKPQQDADFMHYTETKDSDREENTENRATGISISDRTLSILSGNEGRRWQSHLHKSEGSRPSSNRASLEVPELYGYGSMEGLDSSVPNSPQAKALRAATKVFVPSIAMDLSPTQSRRSSPTRIPTLAKVKSKINIFHDRSRNHSRSQSASRSIRDDFVDLEDGQQASGHQLETPITPHQHKRSTSPLKKGTKLKTDEKSSKWKAGRVRRRAEEIPSGIRGLFKSGRKPVSTISDLWRKETSPPSAVSSNTSTDDSDLEYNKESSADLSDMVASAKYLTRYDDDLPIFTSPFKPHHTSEAQKEDGSTESPKSHHNQNKRGPRSHLPKPPRIDVHGASPCSSPGLAAVNRSSHNSDVSDIDDRLKNRNTRQSTNSGINKAPSIHGVSAPGVEQFPFPLPWQMDQVTHKVWSISDNRSPSTANSPITRQDIARVKLFLLRSGIRAGRITHRAAELQDVRSTDSTNPQFTTPSVEAWLLKPARRSQRHVLAAHLLSQDIQLSSQTWQSSAEHFSSYTVEELLTKVEAVQDRIIGRSGLSMINRAAEHEADEVSRDLVTGQTLKVKELIERMETLLRRRRRRFRWLRRAGWVAVEWVLVGVLWWVWLVVMLIKVVQGMVLGVVSGVRWLFWL